MKPAFQRVAEHWSAAPPPRLPGRTIELPRSPRVDLDSAIQIWVRASSVPVYRTHLEQPADPVRWKLPAALVFIVVLLVILAALGHRA